MLYCILIPTYNNARTLSSVIDRSLSVCSDVIVVNDGSTDDTIKLLSSYGSKIDVISYEKNRGKGYALKRGLLHAKKRGFRYAITLDSDGQHFPEDAALLVQICTSSCGTHGVDEACGGHVCRPTHILVVGCRNLSADGMPRENSFANRFSNFWFKVQTGNVLPDTQSGYRLYDLEALPSFLFVTNRYESELELLVFSVWRGVKVVGVPVRVYYAPEGERVSHFRPFMDFFRISVLNTLLCFAAIFYGYPRMLLEKVKGKSVKATSKNLKISIF